MTDIVERWQGEYRKHAGSLMYESAMICRLIEEISALSEERDRLAEELRRALEEPTLEEATAYFKAYMAANGASLRADRQAGLAAVFAKRRAALGKENPSHDQR